MSILISYPLFRVLSSIVFFQQTHKKNHETTKKLSETIRNAFQQKKANPAA